jgi:hypothetical protein
LATNSRSWRLGCRPKNPVSSPALQNLNALFGVDYRENQRFSVPQLGYLGYHIIYYIGHIGRRDCGRVSTELWSRIYAVK